MEAETFSTIQALSNCKFAPATPEKRFIRQLAAMKQEDKLSEKQLMYLGQIRYRYTKQLQANQRSERQRDPA